ncbi:MAG: DUF1566 domain-containing protein [Treponema sp.]|nr:DUF1566 domain-containing protein [Treponema sp.]
MQNEIKMKAIRRIEAIRRIAIFAVIAAIGFAACVDAGDDACSYCSWIVTAQPTCTTVGNATRLCSVCEVSNADIPALGHNYNWVFKYTEYPATLTESCNRCLVIRTTTRPVKIGDTGPGGGIIFYVADGQEGRTLGFSVTSTSSAFTTYTAYYLEGAPANSGAMRWTTQTSWSLAPDVTGTSQIIGSGRNNTALIIAAEKAAYPTNTYIYAALACDNYNTATASDWFLPSRNELNELYRQRSYFGLSSGYFWSSSQSSSSGAWVQDFSTGVQSSNGLKNTNSSVRAVRAF